jgi:hypothetical protein
MYMGIKTILGSLRKWATHALGINDGKTNATGVAAVQFTYSHAHHT